MQTAGPMSYPDRREARDDDSRLHTAEGKKAGTGERLKQASSLTQGASCVCGGAKKNVRKEETLSGQ